MCQFWLGDANGSRVLTCVGVKWKQTHFYFYTYRVFDNDRNKVWAYCSDQKASLELKIGGKISMSLIHFHKYMSNKEKEALRFWMAMSENVLKFRIFLKIYNEEWWANCLKMVKRLIFNALKLKYLNSLRTQTIG